MKVGPVFSESLHTENISQHYNESGTNAHIRYWFFPFLLCISFLFLSGRLFYLQILQGNYYRQLSDSNRIHSTPIHAPRGIIFDRNGNPLVINTPGYRERINAKTIFISPRDALPLLAKNESHLEIDSLREYPCGIACADVVGYTGQISKDQLKDPLFSGYLPTDVVGQMGVEEYYEPLLKGIDGHTLTEVDATGKTTRILGQTDPIQGQNITLTLDEHLQKVVATAMKDVKKGAAIVSTTKGEILALYSAPSFDPNLFTMGKQYVPDTKSPYTSINQVLLDGTNQPLLDRAISGIYPPGSTFKIVVAAAALQNNIIDSTFTVNDEGVLKVGNFSFANWYYTDYGKTEGQVNVVKAIQRSNDIFFYIVGQKVGVDRLSAFAKFFGLGSPTGIDLPGEAGGLLPTKAWKEKVIGDKWYLGDDYHYGIGQGYLLTTPLQVNLWTQAIANGGVLYTPHLIKTNPILKRSGLLTKQNADLITQGMIEACSTGGVAWPFFTFTMQVACKTGTAQHGNDATLPDAWITVFAPAHNPQVVVTVLAEDSGEGSNVAGPIAKEILTKYFNK